MSSPPIHTFGRERGLRALHVHHGLRSSADHDADIAKISLVGAGMKSSPGIAAKMFRTLAEERRRREMEPTLSMLRSALLEEPGSEADRIAQERMRSMHDLIDLMSTWFDDVQRLDAQTLAKLMRMGSKVQKLLELTGQLKSGSKE